ncbi:hypothetical protein [Paraburkholderia rhizosphaerae]|uniref:LysR substrate binding domain-containing protein n=1 Tax=Paraburkholderia rhizosphaerae TaxID=480658 RepID=A0A4R8L7R6_9BURK|nr:hypothetical protein [Paraburkholderia rhizosphaerae]TDY38786.1 hypothetical protein BX592_13012 [Paraburkholderia rhizosphaerae]
MRVPQHLNALRAFEAVARHLSYVGAADELHAYYVVHRKETAQTPPIVAFKEWMIDEAGHR